ncbi:hypothetical protein [Paenibacillus polymyxa]|uniref:hypothetical protein n=1 Tax=Paenibacillus polymyxa TaxID=1406 RepID=UPI000589E6CC|nr:hypothetical protein [Paenibacillus polymyxa]AJE51452.1 hypothetical protein RE92_10570 [Paenibacillus polymyxa]QOH60134.1 hypothetical protein DI243_01140 [Paenibacillus polymyxa]
MKPEVNKYFEISDYFVELNYYSGILKIIVDIQLSQSLSILKFNLDDSYKLLNMSTYGDSNIEYFRNDEIISVSSKNKFSKIKIQYCKKDKEWLNITPVIYHFPEFNDFLIIKPFRISIKSEYSFITNERIVGSEILASDLKKVVILWEREEDKKIYIEIKNRGIFIKEKTYQLFGSVDISLELGKFLDFYYSIFNCPLDLKIIEYSHLDVEARAYKNLIVINAKLYTSPMVLLYKYLFHEIIHQEIGIKNRFYGKGSYWLLESLTEFLQLLYLKERFNDAFFRKQLKFYENLYKNNIEYTKKIPISLFSDTSDQYAFLAIICGKGVLAFFFLYEEFIHDKQNLKKIFSVFNKYNNYLNLNDFQNILVNQTERLDVNYFFNDWIFTYKPINFLRSL